MDKNQAKAARHIAEMVAKAIREGTLTERQHQALCSEEGLIVDPTADNLTDGTEESGTDPLVSGGAAWYEAGTGYCRIWAGFWEGEASVAI